MLQGIQKSQSSHFLPASFLLAPLMEIEDCRVSSPLLSLLLWLQKESRLRGWVRLMDLPVLAVLKGAGQENLELAF